MQCSLKTVRSYVGLSTATSHSAARMLRGRYLAFGIPWRRLALNLCGMETNPTDKAPSSPCDRSATMAPVGVPPPHCTRSATNISSLARPVHQSVIEADDPILVAALLNRRLLDEALLAIETAVSAAADRAATASLQQTETARQIAADLITQAGEWSARSAQRGRARGQRHDAAGTQQYPARVDRPRRRPCAPRSPSASPFSSSRSCGVTG